MIRALSGTRKDVDGCMVLLEVTRNGVGSLPETAWCPNTATRRVLMSHHERGTVDSRVCAAHEHGLRDEGWLFESKPLEVAK
jgi:hypothetical protein